MTRGHTITEVVAEVAAEVEKLCTCDVCEKRFKNADACQQHKRAKHTLEDTP